MVYLNFTAFNLKRHCRVVKLKNANTQSIHQAVSSRTFVLVSLFIFIVNVTRYCVILPHNLKLPALVFTGLWGLASSTI